MPSTNQSSPEQMSHQPSFEEIQGTVEKLTAENLALRQENERLERIALKDPLTGMFNRRGLTETTSYLYPSKDREVAKEERSVDLERQRATAVLIADIDNFKIVNDTYGHPAGDLVLKKAADFFRENLRATDIVSRWGGEEFVAVFRGAKAQDVINKFYQKTDGRAELNLEIELNGEKMTITMSGGVTDLVPGETIETAVARADQGLYRAKENGKNRIEKAQP
jgi:diguanylate cyclase (GGDEF)-like protein